METGEDFFDLLGTQRRCVRAGRQGRQSGQRVVDDPGFAKA
jgi:hypothetical protein